MIDFERLLGTLAAHEVAFVVVGGVAATVHGSARLTVDLDVVYDRSPENLRRLAAALAPLDPYLRGAPAGLPFRWDEETIRRGLNFTLTTSAGPLDLFGELAGVGGYEAVNKHAETISLFGGRFRCIDLTTLIQAKRAAGRPKDLEAIAELEAINEQRAADPANGSAHLETD